MVDEERGVNGSGVLTKERNAESLIRCGIRVANDDANSREREIQAVNGENQRECAAQLANRDENPRECEVVNGDANLREFETQMANGDAYPMECETQVVNGDANLRVCDTREENDDDNPRECETQAVNGDANPRVCDTQVENDDGNPRECETQVANGDENPRECEVENGDENPRECDVANGDAYQMECETEVVNGDIYPMECETRAVNVDANSIGFETQMTHSGGDSKYGIRMYKRRKYLKGSAESKVHKDGKASTGSASQVSDKTINEPVDTVFDNISCDQVLHKPDSNSYVRWSGDSQLRHGRDLVLEEMYQSLCESEGGLRECIRNALMPHPENDCPSTLKDRHCFGEGRLIFPLGEMGVLSNGSLNDSNYHSNTEMCKQIFFNILVSEKFTELCNLLFRSFHGVKLDRVLDVSVINSRMKEGAYESSPTLFHSDIQQLWTRLQNVGNEMVALGKTLSNNTMTYCKKVGASVCSTSEDGKNKHFAQESDMLAYPEQTETHRVCTCRHCGGKAEGENCLVCDSCEEMYHVSCINPPVEEVPLVNWYCTNCVTKGAEEPHEDCVLCERINASRSPINGILVSEDEEDQTWARCHICRNEVKTSQKYRTCGHLHCANKYYHDSCLTSKQLGIYASCWYCPCCLCRSCLTDKDDDKIVMCDGCDQAYHIYCMQPPLESIPKGKWFCSKCDAGIERIRRAKKAYESRQNKLKGKELKGDGGKGKLKSGGVDMLLTAAKTLNYQENMEELRKKR